MRNLLRHGRTAVCLLTAVLVVPVFGTARAQVSARYVTFVTGGGQATGPTVSVRTTFGQMVAGRAGRLSVGFAFAAKSVAASGTSAEQPPGSEAPRTFELHQNYPNPFNPVTTVTIDVAQAGPVRLEVFDSLGRMRLVALDGRLEAGRHTVAIDAEELPSGVYVYRVSSGSFADSRRMILLK